MGLSEKDLKKVPKDLTVKECYARIYDWHKTYGKDEIGAGSGGISPVILHRDFEEAHGRTFVGTRNLETRYIRAYLALLRDILTPDEAKQEDIDLFFDEVVKGLMEWAYRETDHSGIKLAVYAYKGIEAKYGSIETSNSAFRESVRKSFLYSSFGDSNWEGRY